MQWLDTAGLTVNPPVLQHAAAAPVAHAGSHDAGHAVTGSAAAHGAAPVDVASLKGTGQFVEPALAVPQRAAFGIQAGKPEHYEHHERTVDASSVLVSSFWLATAAALLPTKAEQLQQLVSRFKLDHSRPAA